MKYVRLLALLFIVLLVASCQSAGGKSLELARSTENSVEVIVTLTRASDGQVYLSATFTPVEKKLHLYSKDTPRTGVDGVGRPSLLELSAGSALITAGELRENAATQSYVGAPELQIYPEGAVTLSLPVILPPGTGWREEEVLVTYMACTDFTCRPPVEDKAIPVRIPENDAFN